MKYVFLCFFSTFLIVTSASFYNIQCRPPTAEELSSCQEIQPSADCQVIMEPNCGPCSMCAKKIGEPCGAAVGNCEDGLECLAPPKFNLFRNHDDSTLKKFCYRIESYNQAEENLFLSIDRNETSLESLYYIDYKKIQVLLPTQNDRKIPRPPFPNRPRPCHKHEKKLMHKNYLGKHEWLPSCNKNGHYRRLQCELSYRFTLGRCWCVKRNGKPRPGFVLYENESECRRHKRKPRF